MVRIVLINVSLLLVMAPGCKGVEEKTLAAGASDHARAAAKACDGNDWTACARLAAMYQVGSNGLGVDEPRAKTLLASACDGDVADACKGEEERNLDALTAETGSAYPEARGFAKACDGGGMTACMTLAEAYYRGRLELKEDHARARRLVVQACKGKNEDACEIARHLLSKDELEPEIREVVITIGSSACAAGDGKWCAALAECVSQGACAPGIPLGSTQDRLAEYLKSDCKDLETKKPDCKKAGAGTPAAAAMQTACEASIDAVVKADNKDACKAAIEGIGQLTK